MKKDINAYAESACGVIRQEFVRVICGYRWYLTVILIVVLWFFLSTERNSSTAVKSVEVIVLLSNEAKLLILAGALPVATSFSSDWQNSYIRSAVIRSGSRAYVTGKLTAFCLITFITNFTGMILFTVIKGITGGFGFDSIGEYYLFYDIISGRFPFLYCIIQTYLYSIVNTMYALFGYVVSAILPNTFVAVMAPMFMGIMIEEITSHGIAQIYPYRISVGNDYLSYNTFLNLLLSSIIIIMYMIIAAVLFKKITERRIRNEIV